MNNLSWYLRGVLGLTALAILFLLGFGIYYTLLSADRNQALDYETYPQAQELNSESTGPRSDRSFYSVQAEAFEVVKFYQDRDYVCLAYYGYGQEGGELKTDAHLFSRCTLNRSHSLGFEQYNIITVNRLRTPVEYQNDDPQGAIVGGLQDTGEVQIEVLRQWSNTGLLGTGLLGD
jgi:hypothetical protein